MANEGSRSVQAESVYEPFAGETTVRGNILINEVMDEVLSCFSSGASCARSMDSDILISYK